MGDPIWGCLLPPREFQERLALQEHLLCVRKSTYCVPGVV